MSAEHVRRSHQSIEGKRLLLLQWSPCGCRAHRRTDPLHPNKGNLSIHLYSRWHWNDNSAPMDLSVPACTQPGERWRVCEGDRVREAIQGRDLPLYPGHSTDSLVRLHHTSLAGSHSHRSNLCPQRSHHQPPRTTETSGRSRCPRKGDFKASVPTTRHGRSLLGRRQSISHTAEGSPDHPAIRASDLRRNQHVHHPSERRADGHQQQGHCVGIVLIILFCSSAVYHLLSNGHTYNTVDSSHFKPTNLY